MGDSRLTFHVLGRVQGVGFREATKTAARQAGLRGWVQNLPDGAVSGVAEGEPAALDAFLDFLRRGPKLARVERVETALAAATGEYAEFIVRRQ